MAPVVLKFGGTSVRDADALRRLVQIVRNTSGTPVVVVSALAGVTNALVEVADACADGARHAAALDSIVERHLDLASELTAGALQQAAIEHLAAIFQGAAALVRRRRPFTAADRDAVLAAGELASSRLVSAVLSTAGVDAIWIDARRAVVTDDRHGAARPHVDGTRAATRREILPYLARRVPVVGGFVGATRSAQPTTLGRGGSDYSAAILGAALDASRVEIWTDVDGLLSADPLIVPDAQTVPRLSGMEAYDLARFGARVLHAGTLEPVAKPRIPVVVRNARRPAAGGTEIRHHDGCGVAGLAHRPAVSFVDLVAHDLGASNDFLRLVAECVDHSANHAVTPVAVSPQRALVAVDDAKTAREVGRRLRRVADVVSMERGGLVALVGQGVQSDASAWRALLDLHDRDAVRQVVQSSSGCALVAVTAPSAAADVVRELHGRVIGSRRAMEVA
jgi:aspartate kinase